MKNYFIYSTLLLLSGGVIQYAAAYTGECTRPEGVAVISLDLGDVGVPSESNAVDTVVVNAKEIKASGIPYRAACDIPKDQETNIYLTTEVPLTAVDSNHWFALNDYLSVRTSTQIGGNRHEFIWNPFKSESNQYKEKNGNETNWKTGGRQHISIRIDKKFVGFSHFSKLVLVGYGNALKEGVSTNPLFEVYLSGGITVPQSCDLDAGTTITMDFGNIGAPLFSQAGAGNKPAGVNPQTHTIAVKCKNIDAQALLSMRLESTNVSGNAMVSDNNDVGFIVADGNRTPLTPNNINSKIRFQLDDNSAATVPITAWPVSVTGNKPAEGRFTAEGYLRVDFD
ncbi:fimbrial protein [Serratia liquefaciens]|uniref:fimbrial protein n=1 Tax=Serratia liquefaciens TaxID=614 RepID=UPI00382771DB